MNFHSRWVAIPGWMITLHNPCQRSTLPNQMLSPLRLSHNIQRRWMNPDSAVKDTYAEMGSPNQTPTSSAWNIEEILYSQFGFSPLDPEAPSGDGDLPWITVSKAIGLTKLFIPQASCLAIQAFVTKMINNATDARAIWTIVNLDISTNAASPLRNLCCNSFVVTSMTFRKTTFYLLSADNSQTPQPCWRLAINDPTAMLQCFRVDLGSSLWNAVCFLLTHGISFNMFACCADLSRRLPGTNTERVYAPHSLGWCPANHKPGLREYIIYEELRDRLLSRPYRHVALLHGGIVWCLTLHTLKLPAGAPSVQIHVRYKDNMMTMWCLRHPSGRPADSTMYMMLTGQPDNIK